MLTDTDIAEIRLHELRLIEKAERICNMKSRNIETFHSERDLSLSIESMIRNTKEKLDDQHLRTMKLNAALK